MAGPAGSIASRLLVAVLALSVFLPGSPATSAPAKAGEAMTFEVVATAPACPGCVVVNATGEVTADSSRVFALFLAQSRLKNLLPKEPAKGKAPEAATPRVVIAFDSVGGNVTPALVIGRRIRELGWTTLVGQGRLVDGRLSFEPAGCFSACSMMILGGRERLVVPKSRAGVHQFSPDFGDDENFSAEQMRQIIRDYGRTVTLVYDYAMAMGVDVRFLVETLRTPFSGIQVVPREEWLKLGLATRLLPESRPITVSDIVGLVPSQPLPKPSGWTVEKAEGSPAVATFVDPERGTVSVRCLSRESAMLDLSLRGFAPVVMQRIRAAAVAQRRIRLGEREIEITEVADTGQGEQTLSARLDARDLNALRDSTGRFSLAILNRSGKPAAPAIDIDATGAAEAITSMMADCGGA